MNAADATRLFERATLAGDEGLVEYALECLMQAGDWEQEHSPVCECCAGSGWLGDDECVECEGSGIAG